MKSTLLILFNQDYSRNIPKLDALYRHRFGDVRYIVPDHHSATDWLYRGGRAARAAALPVDQAISWIRRSAGRKNPGALGDPADLLHKQRLLRVCGHQFYFYHFLFQCADAIRASKADWIWVVGDDALLNPRIDERSIAGFLGISAEHDAMLCLPVLGSDAWIRKIAGSVPSAVRSLKMALPSAPDISGVAPEPGADENRSIPVACADFFGIRRDRLEAFFAASEACFAQKIYVEMAVPNILLATCGNVRFLERFDWRRIAPGEWKPLADILVSSPDLAFVHPVKFSQVGEGDLPGLCTPNVHKI